MAQGGPVESSGNLRRDQGGSSEEGGGPGGDVGGGVLNTKGRLDEWGGTEAAPWGNNGKWVTSHSGNSEKGKVAKVAAMTQIDRCRKSQVENGPRQ